jgi:hypothetical protein
MIMMGVIIIHNETGKNSLEKSVTSGDISSRFDNFLRNLLKQKKQQNSNMI